MKPKLVRILAMAIALGALTVATDASWGRGGGGGGGHGGGGHGGGGHGGGGHAAGGHGGGHWGGGGHGGKHFGGGHISGRHFAGGHHGAAHFGESHIGRNNRFAGGHQLSRNHFNHNAFGNRHGWNHFARFGAAGWGGWGGGWGGWGGWVGPVFWPFLLGDVLSCAFWPYTYCYPFWSYGTFFAYDYGPYEPAYFYGGTGNIYGYAESNRYGRRAERSNQITSDVTQSCGGFAPGVTGFPIDRIRNAIRPTGEALMALDELNDASSKASNVLSASCPSEPPLTPLGRLDAVEARLAGLNPAAPCLRSANAAVPLSLLVGEDAFEPASKTAEVRRWLAEEANHDHAGHAHHGDHGRHDQHIHSFTMTFDGAVDWTVFGIWLTLLLHAHGVDVLRVKGILNVGEGLPPVVINGVQHVFHPPTSLPAWPDDDRRTRLVFIVRDIAPKTIQGLFDAFMAGPRIDQPDRAAIVDNPLVPFGGVDR